MDVCTAAERNFHLCFLSLAGEVFPNLLRAMKAASSLFQSSETNVCQRLQSMFWGVRFGDDMGLLF